MRSIIIGALLSFGGGIVLTILASTIRDHETYFWVAAGLCFVTAFMVSIKALKLSKIKIINPTEGSSIPRIASVQIHTGLSPNELQVWVYSSGSKKWYPQLNSFLEDGDYLIAENCTFGSVSDSRGTRFKVAVLKGRWSSNSTYPFLPAGATMSPTVSVIRE
ncbi:MAG: hypothetical protein WBW81_07835 [Methylocella sp.]